MALETSDHYVSTNGDDGNLGTSEAEAWRTIDYALSQDYSGAGTDVLIVVAPGTYREAARADYPGPASFTVTLRADPQCRYFANENPGRVRLTACDADETPQSLAHVLRFDASNWCVEGFHIDGQTNAYTVVMSTSGQANQTLQDCHIEGKQYGVTGGVLVRRCVVQGATGAISSVQRAEDCILLAGSQGAIGGTYYNCLALGGSYGFRNATAYNCASMSCGSAVRDSTVDRHWAIRCSATQSGTCTVTNSYAVQSAIVGSWTDGKQVLVDLAPLLELLPWQATSQFLRAGDNTAPAFGASDVDVSGYRLRLKGATLDVGPWSIAEPVEHAGAVDWATYQTAAPGLKLACAGDRLLRSTSGQADQAITATVQVKHVSISGDKPQLVMMGDGIATQTATCTAADDTWEELEVQATPTISGMVYLLLRGRHTTGNVWFSDPIVEVGS